MAKRFKERVWEILNDYFKNIQHKIKIYFFNWIMFKCSGKTEIK